MPAPAAAASIPPAPAPDPDPPPGGHRGGRRRAPGAKRLKAKRWTPPRPIGATAASTRFPSTRFLGRPPRGAGAGADARRLRRRVSPA